MNWSTVWQGAIGGAIVVIIGLLAAKVSEVIVLKVEQAERELEDAMRITKDDAPGV